MEPVDWLFLDARGLIMSYDTTSDVLPICIPAVRSMTREAAQPALALHVTVLSDIHFVPSQSEKPTRML